MNSSDVFDQIEKMGDLPSLPQTLLNIQTVANDRSSCADDLAACILEDQALTMRVLKVVNSAMFQRRNLETVRTVRRAVIVMGFNTVRHLALGLSVFDMMSKLSRSPHLAVIAQHSLVTGGFAQMLAESSGKISPEEAFVTGLIHDIGKTVLIECSPSDMDRVLTDVSAGDDPHNAERRYFGISHERAGRRLAGRWSLPVELQNVIGEHHDIDPLNPPRNLDPLLATIVYANAMAHFTCLDEDRLRENKIMRRAGRVLGIPSSKLEELYGRVAEVLEDLAGCLGFDLGDLGDYGAVVNVPGSVNVAPRQMSTEEIARRTAEQLELYKQVGQGMARGEDPEELIRQILAGAVQVLGFERVVYLQADRGAGQLKAVRWAGLEVRQLAEGLTIPLQREAGALARAYLEHTTVHVPQAHSDAYGDLVGRDFLERADCAGFAVVPVPTHDGAAGVLYGDAGPGGAKGPDVVAEQAQELQGLAVQLGMVLANRVGAV
jgi:HD-like signal output (HDOD) protein